PPSAIVARAIASWRTSASGMVAGCSRQSRVLPSMSVKRKVTVSADAAATRRVFHDAGRGVDRIGGAVGSQALDARAGVAPTRAPVGPGPRPSVHRPSVRFWGPHVAPPHVPHGPRGGCAGPHACVLLMLVSVRINAPSWGCS